MEWNVYYDDSTRKKIIKWNIFNHTKFRKDVGELLNQDLSKHDFANNLDRDLMYYFWHKCEYETSISSWIGTSESEKIDIYDQVKMNWDKFVDYVWSQNTKENNKMKLGKLEEYRGYTGTIEYSGDDNVYFGHIKNIKGLVTYESETKEGLEKEFKNAVDDYIDYILPYENTNRKEMSKWE